MSSKLRLEFIVWFTENRRFAQAYRPMSLLVLGLNHQSAPLAVRETVAFNTDQLPQALGQLSQLAGVAEALILSTCNRTEIYCAHDRANIGQVAAWLEQIAGQPLQNHLYQHHNEQAVQHMMRVASGLDSMVLGEPQITGQLKQASAQAQQAGTLGSQLERLTQTSFMVAKQVRSETEIGQHPVSVAYAAVALAKRIFADLSEQTALLIGAGETIELAARHLRQQQLSRLVIANRSISRAQELAQEVNGYAIGLDAMPEHLAEADIIISSTASPATLISHGMLKQALKKRRRKPIFITDLAVPRDIDPTAAKLADVYLYTVDDLHNVIRENKASRQAAAEDGEQLVQVQVHEFSRWLRQQQVNGVISRLRAQGQAHKDEVLSKARGQLEQGKDIHEVLDYLANTLTNKLLHQPTLGLREAGQQDDADMIQNARQLLGLQENNK